MELERISDDAVHVREDVSSGPAEPSQAVQPGPATFRERMREPIDLGRPVPYLSPSQIADYLGHRPAWVWRKIRSRQLRASRWSGSGELRIAWKDFLAFLAAGQLDTERSNPEQQPIGFRFGAAR